MAPDGAGAATAFGEDGADVVGGDLFHEGVFHHEGEHGEVADDVAEYGEEHVAGAVGEGCPAGEVGGVVAGGAAEGEDVPEAVDGAAEEGFEEHTEGEGGNGVGGEDDEAADPVERGAVAEGFGDAEGDAEEVAEEEAGEAEPEGDGDFVGDELAGGAVGVVVGAHAQAHAVVEEPVGVLDEEGFVEAELLGELLALVFGDGGDCGGFGGAAAAEAAHAHEADFNRAAGEDAGEREAHEGDADEGGDGEEEAADDVAGAAHWRERGLSNK